MFLQGGGVGGDTPMHTMQKVLGANSSVCRSYRAKTGREHFFCPPPRPITLNRVNSWLKIAKK